MRFQAEPGAWVNKMYPEKPEPLPRDRQLDSGEIRDDYVAYEGLGFCIHSFIPPVMIKDPKLRKLWIKARQAMSDVVACLEKAPRSKHYRKPKKQAPKKLIRKKEKGKPREEEVYEPLDLDSIGEEVDQA